MKKSIEGRQFAMNLSDYPTEAITSRTIIKEKGGTVTFFAFAKGQALSEHTTPFEALAHVLEGCAEITVGGQVHRVEAGELLSMPANVPHAVNAVDAFKMLLVMIRTGE